MSDVHQVLGEHLSRFDQPSFSFALTCGAPCKFEGVNYPHLLLQLFDAKHRGKPKIIGPKMKGVAHL